MIENFSNAFDKIGKQWMLITAADGEKVNAMTASWGGLGVIWGKNVAYIFVRESRYTKEFIDKNDTLSLAFFSEDKKEMLEAIRAVFRDETYIQKDLIGNMMYISGIMVTLTKKERELLDLLGEHLPNEIIAERLGLSKRSVENYVSRIFDKFNVKNRYELGRYL